MAPDVIGEDGGRGAVPFLLLDVKTVLALLYVLVEKGNFDMCNMIWHRLNRTVQLLKAGNC